MIGRILCWIGWHELSWREPQHYDQCERCGEVVYR